MDSRHVEDSVKHSIAKNGFPRKIVKLPFKPVYDSCKQYDTSLAKVLENLRREDVVGTIKGNFIEFRSADKPEPPDENPKSQTVFDPSWLGNLGGLGKVQDLAREQLARMTPEQVAEIRKMIDAMSDEEKKNILSALAQKFNPS